MLQATTNDNRLVIINSAPPLRKIITDLHNSARSYGNNIHIPITPHTVSQLASILKQLNQKIEPSIPKLRDVLEQFNSIDDYQAIKLMEDLPQPAVRRTDSWKHQLQAYHFATKVKTPMFDMGVGTGKSKTTVDTIQNLTGVRRVIIAMPKYIMNDVNAWIKQFRVHGNLDYHILTLNKGSVKKRTELLVETLKNFKKSHATLVVLVNYDSMWREPLAEVINKEFNEVIVFDESHRIKSHGTKVSEFAYKVASHNEYRMCLTGTMMANSPLDVFGQFRALDVGIFGTSWMKFRAEYANLFEKDGIYMVTGYKNLDKLAAKIDKISYHASTDVLDLPEPIHDMRGFYLDSKEQKLYNELEQTFGLELNSGTLSVVNKLVLILRLQQLTGGSVPMESDTTGETTLQRLSLSKADLLEQVLTDLSPKEKKVVYYRFNADADAIREKVEKLGMRYGEISGRRYDKAIWDADKVDVLALNTRSGEGIDLTAANYGIGYSFGHSLKDYEQCIGRIQRPPRTSTAYFIHLAAIGTIDEVIYNAIANKQDIVASVEAHYKRL